MENPNTSPGRYRPTSQEVRALAWRPVHATVHAVVYWLIQQLLNGNF